MRYHFFPMKPKDLKFPYKWEERKPVIEKGVLFVPDFYHDHLSFQMPSWEDLFGNQHKVFIEYCSGNGTWIFNKAITNPNTNWVAVEWSFERVRKIWSKMQKQKLSNLFIICGEALTFSREYLKENSLDAAFVNFPDPWPKTKHAKNRLFQMPFIEELLRVIKPQGTTTIVTDDLPYCFQAIEKFLSSPFWKSHFEIPFYTTEWPDYGGSYFDSLWRGKGFEIKYMHFINQKT